MTTSRRRAASSREDELLSRLYQHVTAWQTDRFAAQYDTAAGLRRYRAWLAENAAREQARPPAVRVAVRATVTASRASTAARPVRAVTEELAVLLQNTSESGNAKAGSPVRGADWGAEQAVTELYVAHYRSLVRLAVLLVRDVATAEDVVQEGFIAMHGGWSQLGDSEKALSYLRRSVVIRCRTVLRHRVTAVHAAPEPARGVPGGRDEVAAFERSAVMAALRALPARQREALALRFYADMSEVQIAAAMGISQGAVKSHTARAMVALRKMLEGEITAPDPQSGLAAPPQGERWLYGNTAP